MNEAKYDVFKVGVSKNAAVWILIFIVFISGLLGRVSDFNFALWSIDYSQEFVRRGLGGEIISWFYEAPYSRNKLELLFFCMYFFVSIFILFSFRFQNSFSSLSLVSIFLGGFFIQEFGYDQGRFDILILGFLSMSWILIGIIDKAYVLLVLLFITLFSMLLHEGSALILVPGVMAGLLIRPGPIKKNIVLALIYWIGSILIFSTVYLEGSSSLSPIERFNMAKFVMPFLNPDNDVFNIAGRSVYDNFNWAVERLFDGKTLSRMALNMTAALPYLVISVYVIKQLWSTSRIAIAGLFLIIFSIMPLYILGIDFYRWNALVLTLFFMFSSYAASLYSLHYKLPVWLLVTAIIFALWSGPFGITLALPERGYLIFGIINLISS